MTSFTKFFDKDAPHAEKLTWIVVTLIGVLLLGTALLSN